MFPRQALESKPSRVAALAALACTFIVPLAALAGPPAYKNEPAAAQQSSGTFMGWLESLNTAETRDLLLRIVGGIGLFILGWLLAKLISWVVFRALCSTDLDNKLAAKLGVDMLMEEQGTKRKPEALERGVAQVVFWLLMMLVVVGVLDYAGLEQAAGPIQGLVDTVVQAVPLLGKAVLIMLVAYVAALILRLVVRKGIDMARIDARFAELDQPADAEKPSDSQVKKPFSESAGQVVFWLVMVFGLAGAMDALAIEALSAPLTNAIDSLMALLPQVGIAALIFVVGYVISKIVRTIVTNLLESLGFDRLAERLKLASLFGKSTPSKVAGWLVMAFVLTQTAIAALHRLGLETLSGPLTGMMERFWAMLPSFMASIFFVAIGVFLGRLLRGIVRNALEGVGFDRMMDRLGFGKIATREDELGKPSGLVGFVVQIAVVLLAVVQGLNNLELAAWAGYVDAFLIFAVTRAAVALVVVGVGFAVGNYVREIIHARQQASGEGDAPVWMAEFARSAVLVFAFTAAIHQLGVAEDFVLLSFALLFGGLCLAAALAFGLGSREVAGEIVKDRWAKAKKAGGPRPPTPAVPSAAGLFSPTTPSTPAAPVAPPKPAGQ